MLKIRLQRVGRKNIPTYRVVLTDSKNSTKSGRSLEVLGYFDPVNNKKEINAERVKHWLSVGAQPSVTLHNFFIDKKLVTGKKINKLPRKSPIKKEPEAGANAQAAPAPATEAPQASETPKA